MAVEYMSGWPLSSWISPGAAFFLLVNLLIGAIVVTSRGHQGGRAAASTRRLCRSASFMVLDRLHSISMFSGHHTSLELEAEEQEPLPAAAEAASTPVAVVAAPADGASEIAEEEAQAGEDMSISSDEQAHGLALQGHEQQSPSADVVTVAKATTAGVKKPDDAVVETTVRCAPACRRQAEEAPEGKAALNARAELFIRQFREDLKLQRLNSIINYTRALRRGAGTGTAPPTVQ